MRNVTLLATLLLVGACARGEQLGTEPTAPDAPIRPVPEGVRRDAPMVRVGIAIDTSAVTVSAPGSFELRGLTGGARLRAEAGESWQLARGPGSTVRVLRGGQQLGEYELPVRITTAEEDFIDIAGRRYRGHALVAARGEDRLTAVNVVDLELYLLGVVPREMGRRPASEIEALKAQAIAARTYAIGNLGGRAEQGFDFYATVMDQVYGGLGDEDSIVSRAVTETRGEIVTHDGRPIMAYYSSTCGGHTASAEESWPARGISYPYLRGVSDKVPGTEDQYYCSSSSRFRWKTEWTRDQLLAVLGQTLAAHTKGAVTRVQRVEDVRLAERGGDAERAVVDIVADGRTHRLRADSIRWVLRPQPGPALLNSSLIHALAAHREDDEVKSLAVEGGGWGHAIGMCQVGAMGRARAGHSYREILLAYYTGGAKVERMY